MQRQGVSYRSDFGGLWTDRVDASEEVERRYLDGEIDFDQRYLLQHWLRDGYVILEGAVDHDLCDQLAAELAAIFRDGSDTALYQPPDAPAGTGSFVPAGLPPDRMRLVDLYGVSNSAARILMSPAIRDFLKLVFERAPLCFQGLTFECGSGQGLHQDTAYVVVDRPLELAASWVALEDIKPGSGELMYVSGSHTLPDWKFGGDSKHWDPLVHGDDEHSEWAKWLIRTSEERRLEKRLFRPSKGDVLIWSADLVHGGSPVSDPSLSRRSIVGHYCPVDCSPHYFDYLEGRVKTKFQGGFYSSAYYDLQDSEALGNSHQSIRED